MPVKLNGCPSLYDLKMQHCTNTVKRQSAAALTKKQFLTLMIFNAFGKSLALCAT